MTHIHSSLPSFTTYPASTGDQGSVLPIDTVQFASLFEEQARRSAQQNTAQYATATDSGQDEQKRRQHYIPGKLFDTLAENTVNSAGNPSEKCRDNGAQNFSDKETTKQQYSGNSSDTQSNSEKKNKANSPNPNATPRNNEIIGHSAVVQPPTNNGVGIVAGAGLALPSREMKKLVRVLRNSSLSKRTSVFLTLDLQELGEVKLDVTLKSKKVFITAHVADRRAAVALSFALGELKKQLATIDLTLEHFEVSTGRRPIGNIKEDSSISATVAIKR